MEKFSFITVTGLSAKIKWSIKFGLAYSPIRSRRKQTAPGSIFLDIIYTNAWSTLKVGRCRYGIMTHEDGFIFDDGVVGRLAEDRFHVTTTTGGAAGVLNHMEDYLQTEFPELDG